MPLILCTLRNASARINGVTFKQTEAGMLSEDVTAEQAEVFAAIPGYTVVQAQGKAETEQEPAPEKPAKPAKGAAAAAAAAETPAATDATA